MNRTHANRIFGSAALIAALSLADPPPLAADGRAPEGAIAPFVLDGIEWLVASQHEDGGWGAGSHASQQMRDPHAVQTDPATTAFAAMALVRSGHTPTEGAHRASVRAATEYLVGAVEATDGSDGRITTLTGTQIQSKLGPLVDTPITVQFLSRVVTTMPHSDPLRRRVDLALDTCLESLLTAQTADGGWGGGGWASVLQSSLGCSALEFAKVAGKDVKEDDIASAREHQKSNYDPDSGRASAPDAAGVELYAYAGSQRASAGEARAADELVAKGKREGKISADAAVNEETLRAIGVAGDRARAMSQSYRNRESQLERLNDDSMMSGFGSNGGEEFLSYMMTSESLVIAGGEPWTDWNEKMHERLAKIQSPDGSWTGHHCITSPVFCTAAVVQCLTADRDAALLLAISENELDATTGQ